MADIYQKVREGHRFDFLERGLQSATERNSSHTSVSTVQLLPFYSVLFTIL